MQETGSAPGERLMDVQAEGQLVLDDVDLYAVAGADTAHRASFVVDVQVAGQLVQNLELRLESDSMLNMMSAEDLARFAASDVADALKRVAVGKTCLRVLAIID